MFTYKLGRRDTNKTHSMNFSSTFWALSDDFLRTDSYNWRSLVLALALALAKETDGGGLFVALGASLFIKLQREPFEC